MLLQLLHNVLIAAAILTPTVVQASPFYNVDTRDILSLQARDVFVATTCDPLVYGATAIPMGETCVGISDGTLTITYTVNSDWGYQQGSCTRTPPACTVAANNVTATCIIPLASSLRGCDRTLYIVTHADVTSTTVRGQTAWGAGKCYDTKGNCAKYWSFKEQCACPLEIDFFPITYTTTSVTTIVGESTSSYLTSTTVEYETSSTSTYETSTIVTYLTSTTSEYSTIGSSTSTIISSSIFPVTATFPPTTTTTTCSNPSATTITTTVVTTLPTTV